MQLDASTKAALFEFLLRLGDDRLILGHRLSEWCGHGPILEEDIALANIALDLIGQASALLKLAGEVEGKNRTEDDLAYLREVTDYRNVKLVELPRGDFAFTIARQFLFDSYSVLLLEGLVKGSYADLSGLATKLLKESRYHLRHSAQWMLRLGDGTDESKEKIQAALNDLWMYTAELFENDEVMQQLQKSSIAPDLDSLRETWLRSVQQTCSEATLILPDSKTYMASGSRKGMHTEHLGRLLAEMQILQRSFPGAKW